MQTYRDKRGTVFWPEQPRMYQSEATPTADVAAAAAASDHVEDLLVPVDPKLLSERRREGGGA